jgi:hypothetical protein
MGTKKVEFDVVANDKTGEGLDQVDEKLGDAGDAAESSGLKFTELNSVMEVGNKVFDYAKQAYTMLIQPTIDLGLATSRLSGSLGITTEDASTMIQMLEDYGLTQEETTTAMEAAIRRGYAPTIEGLAQMADGLVAEQDPLKQGALLFDVFGKKGQEVGKLLRGGSADVYAAAKEVADSGRAMTQGQVDDILRYRMALNDLGDVWASVGMQITSGFIPPITEALNALADLLNMPQTASNIFADYAQQAIAAGKTYDQYIEIVKNVAKANGMWNESLVLITEDQYNSIPAVLAAQKAAENKAASDAQINAAALAEQAALVASYSTILELAKSLQSETDSYSSKQEELTKKIADTNIKLAEAVIQYGVDSEQARGYQSSLSDLNGQVTKLEADHTKATATIVYNNLMQKLSVNGLTDSEFAMAQQMGVSLGVFTQSSADQATALNGLTTAVIDGKISQEQFASAVYGGRDSVNALWDSINAIPKNTDVNVNTNRNETYTYTEYRNVTEIMNGSVYQGHGYAAGGEGVVPPGFTHDNFIIGLSSGEKFRTTPSSRVGAAENGGSRGGGNVYNFIANGIQNPREFMTWVNQQIEQQDGNL